MTLRLEWTSLAPDLKLRGPAGAVHLGVGERFRWGRDWRPPRGSRLSFPPMASAISGRAVELWWQDAPAGRRIIVATSQGGARSDGHLDVYGEDGVLQHRLSERGTDVVPLRPGRYRLDVSLLEPICSLDVQLAAAAPVATPQAERLTEAWWDLDAFFSGAVEHEVYATALLAVAATRLDQVRGDRTASDFFYTTLVPTVLGKKKDWAIARLDKRVERRRIVRSPGAERLQVVAQDTLTGLSAQQLADLEAWLFARLAR